MYVTLIMSLIVFSLVHVEAYAGDKPDIGYIIEVCKKAYPDNEKKSADCFMKTAGLDGPPPTQEQVNAMYGAPDDPVRVQGLQSEWAQQVMAHQESYKACKGQSDFQRCMVEASKQEVAIHENLMESLKPPAWPRALLLRYLTIYPLEMVLSDETRIEMEQCSTLSETEKDKCVKTITDETYSAGVKAFFHKVKEHMDRETAQQAVRHQEASDRLRQLRQDEIRTQREHELELARMQALGMVLGNGGLFRPIQPPPTYQPQPYQFQPTPIPIVPSYQPNPVRPPVSCTSRAVGSVLHTDCY